MAGIGKAKQRCSVCDSSWTLCMCAALPRLDLRTKIALVIHHRELTRSSNTGLLALRALVNSELRIRGESRETLDLEDLLSPRYRSLLFYPSSDAVELDREFVAQDPRPIQLIVSDGTWRQARKLHSRHRELKDIPRVKISTPNHSSFQLRAQSRPEGMATLQAIAGALRVIEGDEVGAQLMQLFDARVARTLSARGLLRLTAQGSVGGAGGKKRLFSLWLACGFLAVNFLFPTDSNSQATNYQGKTITVIQGRSAGGVGDLRFRAVFQFLQKHIPGNPVVVSEYMPGGGGRKAANQVYRAKGDGLTIGASSPGILASAVLGEPGVEYDPQKFIYLGSPWSVNYNIFTTRKGAGLNNLEKLRAATGLRIGAQSVGHVQYIRGRLFAWLLDLKDPKFVVGYSGPELDVALERGEIDARAESFDNLLTRGMENEKRVKDFHAILEIPKGHRPPEFAQFPEIESFVRVQVERRVLTMSRVFWGVGTLIFLPPNTPASLAEVLRQAFRSSFKDRQFHEQYRKLLGVDPTPLMPEDQQRSIEELPRDAEVVEVFKKIAGVDPLPPRR